MNKKVLKQISRIAKKAEFTGKVTDDNAREIVQSLAENWPEFLAAELERMYTAAVHQWEFYTSTQNETQRENYDIITDNADGILAFLDIRTDYPGLFPSFEIERKGKHFTEYSALNAIRQYNNFWKHW